jgi:hypothetical protein
MMMYGLANVKSEKDVTMCDTPFSWEPLLLYNVVNITYNTVITISKILFLIVALYIDLAQNIYSA